MRATFALNGLNHFILSVEVVDRSLYKSTIFIDDFANTTAY